MFDEISKYDKWKIIFIIILGALYIYAYVSADAKTALQHASKFDSKYESAKVIGNKSWTTPIFGSCGYWDVVKFNVQSGDGVEIQICKSLFGYSVHEK